ncbi:MAG: TerB family tellurite resistance protein [Nannocystaceae bacterium]|nr:TerB family tellurite resistance protein [Nannocystaceae bacterium]
MPISDRASLTSLAFLFVAFGHSTDGSLSMDEMRALAGRLKQRAPGAELADIAELIKTAIGEYKTLVSMTDKLARAQQHTDSLRANVSREEVQQVLADLREIANADGNISAEEEQFIAGVAAVLGS